MSGTWNFCFDASQVAPKAMSLQQSQVVVRFGCGINVLGIQKKNNPGRETLQTHSSQELKQPYKVYITFLATFSFHFLFLSLWEIN